VRFSFQICVAWSLRDEGEDFICRDIFATCFLGVERQREKDGENFKRAVVDAHSIGNELRLTVTEQ